MGNETYPPEKPILPPANAPKSPPPPPDLPKPPPDLPKPPPVTAPPIKLHIRDAGDFGDVGLAAGGLAPFNARVLAAVLDVVVASGLHIAALMILPSFAGRIAWLLAASYMVTRDSLPFLDGQSVGKKVMKIRVVTRDGKPLTGNWEKSLWRNAALLIPLFAFIELFVLLTREDKAEHGLRLGDEWAQTKVILEPVKPPVDANRV